MYADKRVRRARHLVVHSTKLALLILLESPHVGEMRTGTPLSGGAGQAALAVLAPQGSPPEDLGHFITKRHAANDTRIGVMNVSRVPLQLGAFRGHRFRAQVVGLDWALLERVRKAREDRRDQIGDQHAQAAGRLLLPSLQDRLSQIRFATNATIVPAGRFAQRYWNSVTSYPPANAWPVPHPSNGWWTRPSARKQDDINLAELKRLFRLHTA